MYTIKENINNEIVIQKSRFITYFYKINNKNEINNYLDEIKNMYKDATHYCYAYRLDNSEKCSDDGEPNGTAGTPILHVLQMKNLNNVLCIVIRYFGGIKLGAGGLVRAYTKSVTECLNESVITKLVEGYHIKITLEHSSIKQVDYLLKEYNINKNFDNIISYDFYVSKEIFEDLKQSLLPFVIEIEILENIYI